MAKTELEQIVTDIKKSTKQISINKADEIKVMKSMLNDKNYSIGVYDRVNGYIGQKSPHDEAVKFVKNIIAGSTGLDNKDSQHLAENYKFTNRDATFLISNMKDFLYVYTSTGRKINVMQSADTEAALYIKEIEGGKKIMPNVNKSKGAPATIEVMTSPYTKLVSSSKCPKYALLNGEEE